jgi:hypothetical protein
MPLLEFYIFSSCSEMLVHDSPSSLHEPEHHANCFNPPSCGAITESAASASVAKVLQDQHGGRPSMPFSKRPKVQGKFTAVHAASKKNNKSSMIGKVSCDGGVILSSMPQICHIVPVAIPLSNRQHNTQSYQQAGQSSTEEEGLPGPSGAYGSVNNSAGVMTSRASRLQVPDCVGPAVATIMSSGRAPVQLRLLFDLSGILDPYTARIKVSSVVSDEYVYNMSQCFLLVGMNVECLELVRA